MYIQEFTIDQYGLFSSEKVDNLLQGVNIILGKNEAGKSTLLHYLRCMICGIPQSRASAEYKKIPCIDAGFSGTMLVSTASKTMYLMRKYRAEGRNKPENTLYSEDGKILEYSQWLDTLGASIDLEIYRNIFGISLYELVELTKDEHRVKDLLYGASIGAGIKAPSSILDEIEEKSKKLYIPRGSKTALINLTLSEREKVEAERAECLEVIEEYEHLQHRLDVIKEEQEKKEKEIKEQRDRLQTAINTQKGYGIWKTISVLPDITIEDRNRFNQEIRDELIKSDLLCLELDTELKEAKQNIKEKEIELNNIHCIQELVEKEETIRILESKIPQYEHHIEELEQSKKEVLYLSQEIEQNIEALDASYTREDIKKYSINFAIEQEIAKIKQELAVYTNMAFHKEESIKEIERMMQEIERKLESYSIEEKQYNEISKFENILHGIKEKQRVIEQHEHTVKTIQHNISQMVHAIPFLQWNENDARHNTQIMKFEHAIGLKRHVENYNEERVKLENIVKKKESLEAMLTIKEQELASIKNTIEEVGNNYVIDDLQRLEQIELLSYTKEQLENSSSEIPRIIHSSILFVFCIVITLFSVRSLSLTLPFQWFALCFGGILSALGAWSLYLFEKHIEMKRSIQNIKHIGGGTITSLDDIEQVIFRLQKQINLPNLRQECRLAHRDLILKELDAQKKIKELTKACELHSKELNLVLDEHEKQCSVIRSQEKSWRNILQELYLPYISPSFESIDMILQIRKRIDPLLQEEQSMYATIEQEKDTMKSLFIALRELTVVEKLAQESPFYTQEMMLERCMQYLNVLQENRTVSLSLQEEKKVLEEKLSTMKQELHDIQENSVNERWKVWLSSSQFPQFLTIDTIESFIKRVTLINNNIVKEEQQDKKIAELSEKIEYFEMMVKNIVASLPSEIIITIYELPFIERTHSLISLLSKEKEKYTKEQELRKEYVTRTKRIEELEEKIIGIKARIEGLLRRSNCSTKEEFMESYAKYEEQLQKKKEKEHHIHSLLEIVHPRSLEEVHTLFTQSTDIDLNDAIVNEEKNLHELEQHRNNLIEESGKIKSKLYQAEHEDISKHSLAHSMLTATIENAMKEWYMLKVTKEIILQAQKQFEEKYQPEVMRIASDIMSTITSGAWNRIIRSADNVVKVRNDFGKEKLPEELSRGTQEQMFLALRFAGACVHSMKTRESLPILLDDITVNFDYERTVGVTQAIKNITSGSYNGVPKHQVFLFTCHEAVVETMLNIIPDAKLLQMEQGKIYAN